MCMDVREGERKRECVCIKFSLKITLPEICPSISLTLVWCYCECVYFCVCVCVCVQTGIFQPYNYF